MDHCQGLKNGYKCVLGSKKFKVVSLTSAGIGLSYCFYKQITTINWGIDETALLKQLESGKQNEKLDALEKIIEQFKKNKKKKKTLFHENFKTKAISHIAKLIVSQDLSIGGKASRVLSYFLTNQIYYEKFVSLHGIERLILGIQLNDPESEKFEAQNLLNHLKLLYKLIILTQKDAVLGLEKIEGITLLGVLLKIENTPIKVKISLLKCLTWSCEYNKMVPILLNKNKLIPTVINFLDSTNLKLVEYSISIISDFVEISELSFQLNNPEMITKLYELTTKTDNEQITCNSILALSKLFEQYPESQMILLKKPEFFELILNKFIRSKNNNLMYCGSRLLEVLAKSSISNKILIRQAEFIPELTRLIFIKSINQKLLQQVIATIKELTVNSTKTTNIDFFDKKFFSKIISLFTKCKNPKMRSDLVIIIGNFSCTKEESRLELLNRGALPLLVKLLEITKDANLEKNLVCTFANLLESTELQMPMLKCGGIGMMIRYINSEDILTQYGALIGVQNLCRRRHENQTQVPWHTHTQPKHTMTYLYTYPNKYQQLLKYTQKVPKPL
ncbi:hypothetical protein M0813_04969 [Anaeramoeba flamelloides]|uniref:Uncharacterized protein n=1 Tax=Anaeramoeba flamelloides TaxID=1746091 RepID=A0ABQ8XIK1_9EUKA|nr:hypothetical protein M0813_04969 [Anaeramoeba flamelloides]